MLNADERRTIFHLASSVGWWSPLSLSRSPSSSLASGKKGGTEQGGKIHEEWLSPPALFRLLIYFFSSPPQVPPKNPSHCLSVILLSCETLSKLVGSSNIQTLDLVVFGQNDSIALNLIRSKSKPQRNLASCWSSVHKSGQLYRDNSENLEK